MKKMRNSTRSRVIWWHWDKWEDANNRYTHTNTYSKVFSLLHQLILRSAWIWFRFNWTVSLYNGDCVCVCVYAYGTNLKFKSSISNRLVRMRFRCPIDFRMWFHSFWFWKDINEVCTAKPNACIQNGTYEYRSITVFLVKSICRIKDTIPYIKLIYLFVLPFFSLHTYICYFRSDVFFLFSTRFVSVT